MSKSIPAVIASESWAVMERNSFSGREVHVVPLHDLRAHVLDEDCWCDPVADCRGQDGIVTIHNSADGREDFEEGRRKPS